MNPNLSENQLIRYEVLCFAPSWHCDAKCRHCYLPRDLRLRDNYSRLIADQLIQSLPKSVRVVALTGGEPFLHPRRLNHLMQKICHRGMLSSVVTNALWARDHGRSQKMLTNAHNAGLRAIAVSLDPYHHPRLESHQIIALLKEAKNLNMAINIRGIGKKSRGLLKQIEKSGVLNNQENAIHMYSLAQTGTALNLEPDNVNNPALNHCMSLRYPLVTPTGDVFACCSSFFRDIRNPVLHRGNIMERNLSQILKDASQDYVLAALMVLGPKEINRLAGNPMNPRRPNRCQLCISILNNPTLTEKIAHKINTDKRLRKEIVGRMLLYNTCYKPEFLPQIDN